MKINKCFAEFYCNLYKSTCKTSQTMTTFLEEAKIPQLSVEAVEELEADITLEEIKTTIMQSPNNKTPGPDGFIAEFYKDTMKFWLPCCSVCFSTLRKMVHFLKHYIKLI